MPPHLHSREFLIPNPHFLSSSVCPSQRLTERGPSRARATPAPDTAGGAGARASNRRGGRGACAGPARDRGRAPWRRAAAAGSARWRSACPSSSASSSPPSKELPCARDGGGWGRAGLGWAAASPRGRPAAGSVAPRSGAGPEGPCGSRVREGSGAALPPPRGTALLSSLEALLAPSGWLLFGKAFKCAEIVVLWNFKVFC